MRNYDTLKPHERVYTNECMLNTGDVGRRYTLGKTVIKRDMTVDYSLMVRTAIKTWIDTIPDAQGIVDFTVYDSIRVDRYHEEHGNAHINITGIVDDKSALFLKLIDPDLSEATTNDRCKNG